MRSLKYVVVALMSIVAFAACNKEKSAELALERNSLYFASWDDAAQSISYVATNAESVMVASYSTGWNAMVDGAQRKITIWPTGLNNEGVADPNLPMEGSVVVNALNKEGAAVSYYIYVYVCPTQPLGVNGAANCYVVTTPAKCYTFDVMHRPDGESLDTKDVKLLWQSNPDVVKNVDMVDDKAIFYVQALESDVTRVEDTNAVIAAYNAVGEVVWSWHVWVVNENPLASYSTYSNGKTFMNMNLGAFTNSNGSKDEQQILDSYGMYYQWGRKDPFPRPYFFDASGADDESRYGATGVYIPEKYLERSSSNGTMEYVTKNPMHYITNAASIEEGADGVGDWLVASNNELWSDTKKSVYDPCPYGWRVPTADDFAVLILRDEVDNTPLEEARKQYGWPLSDGVADYFYPACGRRRYTDGRVENMNYKEGVYPSQPQPWEGYYWTSTTTADGKAVSLYFDLTTTRTINKFFPSHSARRANGFQVRCVKE